MEETDNQDGSVFITVRGKKMYRPIYDVTNIFIFIEEKRGKEKLVMEKQ